MTNLSVKLDEETEKTLKYFGFIDNEGRVNKGVKFSPYVCHLIRIDLMGDLEIGKAKEKWINMRIQYLKDDISELKLGIVGMGEILRKKGNI